MDLNQRIEQIISFYEKGGNPSQYMQQMFKGSPNVNQVVMQYKNMVQGKNPSDFLLQLAKQGGVSETNIQKLAHILSAKK